MEQTVNTCKGTRFSQDHIVYCECGWSRPLNSLPTGMYGIPDPKHGYPNFMAHDPYRPLLGVWAWLWCHPNKLSDYRKDL